MSTSSPIYKIAKELNVDSKNIILACNTLGINAKGATKKLNKEELEKVKSYFESGKNVSQETIDLKTIKVKIKTKSKKKEEKSKFDFFPNRLIRKS